MDHSAGAVLRDPTIQIRRKRFKKPGQRPANTEWSCTRDTKGKVQQKPQSTQQSGEKAWAPRTAPRHFHGAVQATPLVPTRRDHNLGNTPGHATLSQRPNQAKRNLSRGFLG